jgi:hypothetical protein
MDLAARRRRKEMGPQRILGVRTGAAIYSTALMTFCLEVYYRYPKVFGAR